MKKIIVSVVIVLVIVVGSLVLLSKKSTSPSEQATQGGPRFSKGDVNKDGKVNVMDSEIIRNNLGCDSGTLACWSRLVGKTVEGDNPIYASDLDLNNDGKIDDADMALAK